MPEIREATTKGISPGIEGSLGGPLPKNDQNDPRRDSFGSVSSDDSNYSGQTTLPSPPTSPERHDSLDSQGFGGPLLGGHRFSLFTKKEEVHSTTGFSKQGEADLLTDDSLSATSFDSIDSDQEAVDKGYTDGVKLLHNKNANITEKGMLRYYDWHTFTSSSEISKYSDFANDIRKVYALGSMLDNFKKKPNEGDINFPEFSPSFPLTDGETISTKSAKDIFKSARGKAQAFLSKDIAKRHIEKIKPEFKQDAYDLALTLGVNYQLDLAAFVLSCSEIKNSSDDYTYDTLFYKDAAGSVLEKVIDTSMDIRKRAYADEEVTKVPEFSIKHRYSSPRNASERTFSKEASSDQITQAMGGFQSLLWVADAIGELLADIDVQQVNFEGLQVVAPVSVACNGASASSYNTDEGIKDFLEYISPSVKSLTIIIVDEPHVYTEYQMHFLKSASECKNEEDYIKLKRDIFKFSDNGSEIYLDDYSNLPQLNKESDTYSSMKNSIQKFSDIWDDKFRMKTLNCLHQNHFTKKEHVETSLLSDIDKFSSTVFNDYKYKSKYDKDTDFINKCKQLEALIDSTLQRLLTDIASSASTYRLFKAKSTKKESQEDISNIRCGVMVLRLLIDNELFKAKAKAKHYSFEALQKFSADLKKRYLEMPKGRTPKMGPEEIEAQIYNTLTSENEEVNKEQLAEIVREALSRQGEVADFVDRVLSHNDLHDLPTQDLSTEAHRSRSSSPI